MRKALALIHRYVNLTITPLLALVALTGGLLAFRDPLDRWLNPDLLTSPIRPTPTLDPLDLREAAQKLMPGMRADSSPLWIEPGRTYSVTLQPRTANGTMADHNAPGLEVYLDPYTGAMLGSRLYGRPSLGRRGVVSFIHRLHWSLALGDGGSWFLGVVALIWTLDCFIGFYLTLPRWKGLRPKGASFGRALANFVARWRPAWLVRTDAGKWRVNYDVHRAFGLWFWPVLLMLAWSSVAFNLDAAYMPVMRTMLTFSPPPSLPSLATPLDQPRLDWQAARDVGRKLMREVASRRKFTVEREYVLDYQRASGTYAFQAMTAGHSDEYQDAEVTFDANDGRLLAVYYRPDAAAGDVLTRWICVLHKGKAFGHPMKLLILLTGLVVQALCVSGVIIWLRKRRGELRRSRRGVSALQSPPGALR